MADITFLLLTFVLMTTEIKSEKGLMVILPPSLMETEPIKINKRNLYTKQINSQNQYLIESARQSPLNGLKEDIKKFILNRGRDKNLSDNPIEAIVSLKTDQGTRY